MVKVIHTGHERTCKRGAQMRCRALKGKKEFNYLLKQGQVFDNVEFRQH